MKYAKDDFISWAEYLRRLAIDDPDRATELEQLTRKKRAAEPLTDADLFHQETPT